MIELITGIIHAHISSQIKSVNLTRQNSDYCYVFTLDTSFVGSLKRELAEGFSALWH